MKLYLTLLTALFLAPAFSQVADSVEIQTSNTLVKGTLTWSGDATKAQPLVILIAGSGPTDRNGNNPQMTNNSLKMLSEGLVANGYACLRYDKRGTAASRLPHGFNQKEMSFEYFLDDANDWVNKFANDVRFNKIIIAGHSQGSLIGMITANKNEHVDAFISLAGPGQPIQEVLKKQLAATLSIEMQGLVNAKLDTLAMGDTLQFAPEILYSIMHPTVQPFLISWMKYDPAIEAAKLKVPALFVNGTTDVQVSLDELNSLAEAQPNAKVVKIKNMNHIFKPISSKDMGDQLELYDDPEVAIHKKLIPALNKFLSGL